MLHDAASAMQNLLVAALGLAPRRIEYYSYGSAVVELTRLATLRPDLASLSTAQALYELPTAGTCRNADGSRSACLTRSARTWSTRSARGYGRHRHKKRPRIRRSA